MKVGEVKSLMYAGNDLCYDIDNPKLPCFIYKTRRACPKTLRFGDMIKCEVYECFLAPLLFCFTNFQRRRSEAAPLCRFREDAQYFMMVVREYRLQLEECQVLRPVRQRKPVVFLLSECPFPIHLRQTPASAPNPTTFSGLRSPMHW